MACLMLMKTSTLFDFYDLPAVRSLKMMRFETRPSHTTSGCDRKNGGLMISAEKTKKLGAIRVPVLPRPRPLSHVVIRE
jgi:hypothetical protein